MTIQEIASAVPDPGPAFRPSMPSTGCGLVARDAMDALPAGIIDLTMSELPPLSCIPDGGDADDGIKAPHTKNTERAREVAGNEKPTDTQGPPKKNTIEERGRKSKRATAGDAKETSGQDVRVDCMRLNVSSAKDKTDVYVTSNVLNKLSENGDAKKNKVQTSHVNDTIASNQPQSVSAAPKRKPSPAREGKKSEGGNVKDRDESFIRENIAGNNAGHYIADDILPIQYTGTQDGPQISVTATPYACATCGEGVPSQPGGVCKQCMHRGRHTDPKAGAFDEIIAYAQSLAQSVKKMLTIQEDHQSSKGTNLDSVDVLEVTQAVEQSQKLQRYQSELARQRGTSYVMGADDKQPRRLFEPSTPAASVCGDDLDTMSLVDGDISKEPRAKLERQASSVTSTESRVPLSRAKTKVKALFSSSRTKTFRSRVGGRTRTDHELRNESVTSTMSSRVDARRSGVPEPARKSGRTQTFDSSHLHGRKDVLCRSRMAVIQEGTSVDPPRTDDLKIAEKAHKYAISRSATSPGTNVPGINKLQREKSNFGTGGPLLRTNTKLTLRANKAAVLRMENTQKASTLFHQQPAIDVSEGSPILERKRGTARTYIDNKAKTKPMAAIAENQTSGDMQTRETEDSFVLSEWSGSKQETKASAQSSEQHQTEQTGSDIYCGDKSYIGAAKTEEPVSVEMSMALVERKTYVRDIPEKNPYCDDLHHYGKGLEDQLLKNAVVENLSTVALTPYFDKAAKREARGSELTLDAAGEEASLYTDAIGKARRGESKPARRGSGQWYSLHGVTSKSSTQLRQVTSVRSSLSDVLSARSSSLMGAGLLARKAVKYSETDVDSGTIYHMAKRIASDQKVSSHSEFNAASNFFEVGGDVSKSSSSTSGHSSTALDTVYTGGFFRDAFDDSDKKDISACPSDVSQQTYFEYEGESKPEPIECDIYTGSVFSPSANNLALGGIDDNWRNKSTNNSNRLPSYRCRSRTTMAHINNRRILNCSNNSNTFVARNRSPSPESLGPSVTQTVSSSYIDYAGYRKHVVQPVMVSLPGTIDFTKYDNIGADDTGFFFQSSLKYKSEKHNMYEGVRKPYSSYPEGSNSGKHPTSEDLYTPGDRHTNLNNSCDDEAGLNANNNYFGDFYTGDASDTWGASQERRPSQTSASSGDFTSQPSPKYAPGSFYENAYPEPQLSPPPAQPTSSSFLGMFTGYGEPSAPHKQGSPEYAGSFSHGAMAEGGRSRSPGTSIYEGYGRTSSASPRRQSAYDQDGYFDYHTSGGSSDDRRTNMDSLDRSPVAAVPKIKRVGAIICRENVANKDDYAEDVNRDLMEDPWIPISYRLAAEQVKEMGGGRCSSKDLFKPTEARCDQTFLDSSPFAQGQMLETLGRKSGGGGWNLKQNTDSLKEDISMKWRDAREKSSRQQLQQQSSQHKAKKASSENAPTRTSVSSVWRPTDHIPAKARGNRTLVKSEPRGPTLLDKDGSNTNNSRVWSAVMWVPSTVGSYVKKLW